MITIIDYGMGNLKSLENAFQFLGEEVKIAKDSEGIGKAEKLVFPGVGNFGKAVENLKKKKIFSIVGNKAQKGTPFLGICLGLQLLFEKSEEAPGEKGLSIFKGKILEFKKVKIPQIGWNQINFQRKTPKYNLRLTTGRAKILNGIKNGSFVYFMHSFYPSPADKEIIAAKTNYGKNFCSAIESNNIFGVQFHPEKSGKTGLKILKNFINI